MAEVKDFIVTPVETETENGYYGGNTKATLVTKRIKIISQSEEQLIEYCLSSDKSYTAIISKKDSNSIDQKLVLQKDIFPSQFVEGTTINDFFSGTQRWLCHIESFDKKSIFAKLTDLITPGTQETAEFDIEEVSLEDRALIKIGAGFYWSVGLASEKGQISKKSLIRFQRLIELTEDDYNEAMDRYNSVHKNIQWE
jgi:hypothetical protein